MNIVWFCSNVSQNRDFRAQIDNSTERWFSCSPSGIARTFARIFGTMILNTHMHKYFTYATNVAHKVLYCRKSLCGAMNIVQLCANVSQNMYFEHNTKSRNGSQKFNPSTKISRKSSEKKISRKMLFRNVSYWQFQPVSIPEMTWGITRNGV